jgi:Rrf2 family protein
MKLSTKGRYGLRAMVDLAVYSKGDQVSLNNIGERQGISTNYLEQVFSALRKSGLVKSIKGAQGGYVLAEDSSEIKVGRILRALEGPLRIIDESGEKEEKKEGSIQHCLKIIVWDKMNEALNDVVDSVTLEDLAENYRKVNNMQVNMYYI